MTDTIRTKSQIVADDIVALMQARTPIIWIVTREERRVERYLVKAAEAAGYRPVFWDVAAGLTDTKVAGKKITDMGIEGDTTDFGKLLASIEQRASRKLVGTEQTLRTAWIVRDPQIWLQGMPGAGPLRALRNLAKSLPRVGRDNAQSILILATDSKIPDDLQGHTTLIEWPLPDRAEIGAFFDDALKILPEDSRAKAAPNGTRDLAIDAAVGLTGDEAASCYAKSLVSSLKIDPAIVSAEKKRIITKSGMMQWIDPFSDGLGAVGGLEELKDWLVEMEDRFTPDAREFGLPAPKGVALIGMPGCGKSLVSKCFPTAWGFPLIRLDLNALKGKFVGESEGNIRKALKIIEAIGRCVVWIDEIEKALQGATSGSSDGGTSTDALGTLLTWLQERRSETFVVATANDTDALPPELFRKGRFDEIFYVGLPNEDECVSVLKATLRRFKRETEGLDLRRVARACRTFTGSEVAELVPSALHEAFRDGKRAITTDDLIKYAMKVVPLSKSQATKLKRIEAWKTDGRARSATREREVSVEELETAQIDLSPAA